MSIAKKHVPAALLAVALVSPVVISGCAARGSYTVYDPYYRDNHRWDSNEVVYYQRWETETHRDHQDFKKRNADEQKEYFNWRHSQPDKH